MANPFKKILQSEKLPEAVKCKVMNDVDLIKLSMDLADLIAVKYPDTINNIINLKTYKNKDNEN